MPTLVSILSLTQFFLLLLTKQAFVSQQEQAQEEARSGGGGGVNSEGWARLHNGVGTLVKEATVLVVEKQKEFAGRITETVMSIAKRLGFTFSVLCWHPFSLASLQFIFSANFIVPIILSCGSKLVGLEHHKKTPHSISRKVEQGVLKKLKVKKGDTGSVGGLIVTSTQIHMLSLRAKVNLHSPWHFLISFWPPTEVQGRWCGPVGGGLESGGG